MKTITANCYAGSVKRKQKKLSFLLLTFLSLFFTTTLFVQWFNVNPPQGGFAINGGLRANTQSALRLLAPTRAIGISASSREAAALYSMQMRPL